jgi:enoyl-CoA hydratase/carnithine racemase
MPFIRVETETEIAKVTLDHPKGNRINFAMREELLQAFQRVADSKARVLVVRGNGTDFSLGGDVRDWAGKSAAELTPRIGVFAKAIEALEQLKIPTIAVVQGASFPFCNLLGLSNSSLSATQRLPRSGEKNSPGFS